MQTGTDDELGARIDGGLSFRGRSDGAGAKQQLRTIFLLEFLEQVDGAGDSHGDFDNGDAAGNHGLYNGVRLGRVTCAQNRNQANAFDDFGRLSSGIGHFFLSGVSELAALCACYRVNRTARSQLSARDAGAAAFHGAFHFGERCHAGVAGGGHGERAVSHAAANCPFERLAGKHSVDETGGETVAATDAVEDVDLLLRHVDNLVLIERDGAPGVAAGGAARCAGCWR